MKIKAKTIQKLKALGLPVIGFCLGVMGMFIFFQPKLAYEEKIAKSWENIANQNQKQLASASAELQALQTAPTPTPEIIYKTQYVQPPQQSLPQPQEKCTAYNGTTCVAWQLPPGSF